VTEKALEVRLELYGEHHVDVARSYNNIGFAYHLLGENEKSVDNLSEAIRIFEELGEHDHEHYARALTNLGAAYLDSEHFEEALRYFHRGLRIQNRLFGTEPSKVSRSLAFLVSVYETCKPELEDGSEISGLFHESLEIYEKILDEAISELGIIHPYVAWIINNLGMMHYAAGMPEEALVIYQRSLSIKLELFGRLQIQSAAVYHNMGVVYAQLGQHERALPYLEQALRIRTEVLGEDHPLVAVSLLHVGHLYKNMASTLYDKGDFLQALKKYQRALSMMMEMHGEQSYEVGYVYSYIGETLSKYGRYDAALLYLQKARDIYLSNVEHRPPKITERGLYPAVINEMGVVYSKKEEYETALAYMYEALEIVYATHGRKHRQTARQYYDIGFCHELSKEYDKALRYYDKALKIYQITPDAFADQMANLNNHYANIYFESGELEKGLKHVNRALENVEPGFSDRISDSGLAPSGIVNDFTVIWALHTRGMILRHLFLSGQKGLDALHEALGNLRLAVDYIENARLNIQSTDSKYWVSERYHRPYEEAIATSILLLEETGDPSFKYLAFEFAEKNKAATLREAVTEANARSVSAIPEHLLEHEQELRWDIAIYEVQLAASQQDTEEARQLHDSLFAARQSYRELIEYIEQRYSRYYELKYQTRTVSVGDITDYLDEGAAVLKFFAGEENIFLFAFTENAFEVRTIPSADDVAGLADALVQSIRKIDQDGYVASASGLYELLIGPVRDLIDGKEELIILPDGFLYTIPFEALLDTSRGLEPDRINFASLPYLIRDVSISYHYSATLLEKTVPGSLPLSQASFAGFAPVFADLQADEMDELLRSALNPLPHSEEEIRELVALMEGLGIPAVGFYHDMANKENFLRNARDYSVVHIASHGIADELHSGLSGIVFASPDGSDNYEMLYAREMYDLDLGALLVVIGSCKSGYGAVVRGEGLISMTRGLLYSGSPNIIVTLWEVYDLYTKDLMLGFYDSALSGRSFAHSLRDAKLALIGDEATAFPIFWSGTVLIGR